MAGEATIGAIRVVLGADTAKLTENLKGAQSAIESFAKKALTIATGIQLEKIFEQAFQAVVDSITGAIDAADKLSKASQKFGVPVETLAALSLAAAASEVSIEDLGGAFSKLSRSALAAGNITSDQAAAFKALHVSVKDSSGEVKSLDTLILEVGDSLSKVRNPTVAAQLAIAAFGKAGANLLPVFAQGTQGIRDLQQRIQLLEPNLAADSEAAQHLKDNITALTKAKELLILRILGESGVLRSIEQTTQAFIDMTNDGEQLAAVVTKISEAVRLAAIGWDLFTTALKTAIIPTTTFFKALVQIATGNFAMAWETLKDGAQAFADNAGHAATVIKDLATGAIDFTYVGLSDELIKSALALGKLNDVKFDPEFAKQLKSFNDELNKMRLQALDASGIFAGKLAQGFLAATANMEILKGQVTATADGFLKLGPRAQAFNQEMLKLQGQQAIIAAQTPWEQYQLQIAQSDAGLRALGKTTEEIGVINEKIAERMGVSWKDATRDILQNATSAFEGLAQKNKEFAGIAQGLSIAQATFSAYEAFNKALATYPPPFNFIGAGVALAAGLATVAKIAATPFARGGSFKVPGGISGVDSMTMPLALSPGERVDITPSSQVRDRGGGREITLNGIGPRDLFTGSMLRDLVDALNAGHRDGYRLKLSER